jgi:hypothetical protein
MSIADFIAKAKEAPKASGLTALQDVLIEGFDSEAEGLDKTSTSKSISDSQFRALKSLISEYRSEIIKGSFVETEEKLHNIVMFYRVSREESFIVIKPKVVRTRAPAKPRASKKAIVVIADLM